MARSRTVTLRARPAHTAAKHKILESYLGAWFPIMAKWNPRLIYFDAFSGPGEYQGGVDGSPILALKTLLNHTAWATMAGRDFVFLFNESDSGCAAHLLNRIDEVKADHRPWPANVILELEHKPFVDLVQEIVDDLGRAGATLAPTFAFIDPTGLSSTPMSVLERLSRFDKVEMLVYFAHEAVVRFHAAGQIDDRLDDLFGSSQYRAAAPLAGQERRIFLHDLYREQLRQRCRYRYVRSFAMHDDRGKLLYYLFYCTRDLTGLDRMKHVMWTVAPTGDFAFRDRFAGMDVLFGGDADTRILQDQLAAYFSGRTVLVKEIIDWVIAATPFYSGQVKTKTLRPMQQAGRLSSPNQRRANTYPDGTLITFPAASS